jgi:putative transposase
VQDRLPDNLRSVVVSRRVTPPHPRRPALAAEAELSALAAEHDRTHPGATAFLREGMAETLTVQGLGVPPTVARALRSTAGSHPASVACGGCGAGVQYI